MTRTKRLALAATLGAGILVSLACWAYPMPGPTQETVVTYYSSAARTTEVGVRSVARGAQCQIYHVNWGTTSSYSKVEVLECPNSGGGGPAD